MYDESLFLNDLSRNWNIFLKYGEGSRHNFCSYEQYASDRQMLQSQFTKILERRSVKKIDKVFKSIICYVLNSEALEKQIFLNASDTFSWTHCQCNRHCEFHSRLSQDLKKSFLERFEDLTHTSIFIIMTKNQQCWRLLARLSAFPWRPLKGGP